MFDININSLILKLNVYIFISTTITLSNQPMLVQNVIPDEQSHHHLKINNKQVQLTFRYFSPPKHEQKNNNNSSNKLKLSQSLYQNRRGSLSSSSIANQITVIKQIIQQKHIHNPQIQSDRFYQSKIQQIKYPLLDYYEKFHKRLYDKIVPQQKSTRSIKLQLTSKSKQKLSQDSSLKRTYIKRVQISLHSQKKILNDNKKTQIQQKFNRKPIFGSSRSQKSLDNQHASTQLKIIEKQNMIKPNIVIRLYEPNKKDSHMLQSNAQQVSYITPRRKYNSHRKGIKVYSSQGKRKHSLATQGNIKINNSHVVSIHNISTNNCQKSDKITQKRLKSKKKINSKLKQHQSLKQRYGQQFIQDLKRKTQQTKRRVYSKSKLNRKQNPIIQSSFGKKINNK